jgi:hypothetical protein
MIPSMCCKFGQTGSVTTCAKERGRVWDREEGAGSSVVAGFELKRPQVPAAPARNFAGLAALFCEEVEGKRRGDAVLLIGTARDRNGQGLMRNEEGEVTAGSGVISGPGKKKTQR